MNRSKRNIVGHVSSFRTIAATGIAATLVALTASIASAQITFAGITTYRFDGQPFAATTTLGGLTITQNGFSVTTDALGYAAIGGSANSLGLVSLGTIPFLYTGHTFDMRVAFTTPSAGAQTFFAIVTGSVSGVNGGARINFSPSTIVGIPFTNGPGSGTFDFSVNNIAVTPGQTGVQVTGDITATTNGGPNGVVPEPASVALVGLGIAGIAMAARRRRSR